MEKKKGGFGELAKGLGKSTSELFDKAKMKAVEKLDQDSDGRIGKKDVGKLAENVANVVKDKARALKEAADIKTLELERRALQPFFDEDIDSATFTLPKLVRICYPDKKHAESEVCKGSIGFYTEEKDFRAINIYRPNVEKLGITFYPDDSGELYYVDPSDRDRYIALDEYFSYLKVARIAELQKLAQDPGAKHFRVTYKEKKATFSSSSKSAKVGVEMYSASGEMNKQSEEYSNVSIAAENDFPGHDPVQPQLHYLLRDTAVQNLIAMRMDPSSPLSHQRFTIELSNSSGIKEADAIKIDAVLNSLRCSGNATVANEARNESRRYLEYEVEF